MIYKDSLLECFRNAFPLSPIPSSVIGSAYSDEEVREINAILGLSWEEIDTEFIESYWGEVALLSPRAFEYYLPGFCSAVVERDDYESSIFNCFFATFDGIEKKGKISKYDHERWGALNHNQYDALLGFFEYFDHKIRKEKDIHSSYLKEYVQSLQHCIKWIDALSCKKIELN